MIKPKIVELNFGMGNIRSLQKAFEYWNQPVSIITDPSEIASADALLIPGDGAFAKAMEEIHSIGFYDEIINFYNKKKPILGVCIGFQILFSESTEFGIQNGLNLVEGKIQRIQSELPVPHVGWSITQNTDEKSILMAGIPNNSWFYYVHSYCLNKQIKETKAICSYGSTTFTSIIERENLFGVQFHPEKSQKMGLQLISNFIQAIKQF